VEAVERRRRKSPGVEEVVGRSSGGRAAVCVVAVCAVRNVVGRVKVKPGHGGVGAHMNRFYANLRRLKLSHRKLAPYLRWLKLADIS
jgi:hypothetical protein